ncbi:MAG: hypothetical protein H6551_07485 [Chitinophagales bacterium]|nr:hypothetical protein [Chitinophagaceae bacterium]MCB9064972.1 hypothetical protein [Chitinophagales bacterium]
MSVFSVRYLLPVLLLLLQACNNKEGEYQVHEDTPDYVVPATIKLNELRETGDTVSFFNHLDSLYNAVAHKNVRDKFYVWYLYADSYGRLFKRDKALAYTDSIITLLEKNDPSNFARDNYIWAFYYKADKLLQMGQYQDAYENYYHALSFAEKFADTCAIGYYHLKIGLVLYDAKQYKDALAYFKIAREYCEHCDNNFGYFYRTQELESDIGICYERMGQYDSAIYYYSKGIRLIDLNKGNHPDRWHTHMKLAKCVFYGNMGGTYVKAKMYDSAEATLKRALSVKEYLFSEPIDAQFTKIKLAGVYIHTGRLPQAIELLDDIKKFNDSIPDNNVEKRWGMAMWQYWEVKNDLRKAFKYLKNYAQELEQQQNTSKYFSLASIDNNVKNIGNESKILILEQSANQNKIYLIIAAVFTLFAIVIIVLIVQSLERSKKHVSELTEMNDRVNEQSGKLKLVLKELEHADAEKDRILKAVSHDMRSPINSSLALLDIISAQDEKLDDEQKEYLSLMKQSNQNALNLTKDLLEIATLKTEELEKDSTDLTALMEEQVKLLNFKAREKNQNIVLSVPEDHISAKVNAEKIARVVSNLITNAVKFSSDGMDINVSLSSDGENFKIVVQDQGIGIPQHLQEKVFDLFSEAKRFGTSGEQPFGLGLSISKQIAEAHNGKIWLESQEGVGTTFYVQMPIAL